MSQGGASPSAIIASLEQHRIQLDFTGSQFAKLKDQGVPDEVLDYLLNAYASRLRYEVRLQSEPLVASSLLLASARHRCRSSQALG
ncbi:MAG: hypothetical protein EXR36_10365 [Betaproteobacteria bacterium]|nr:hypothetical protein [Betaproteobacteria bacterium]